MCLDTAKQLLTLSFLHSKLCQAQPACAPAILEQRLPLTTIPEQASYNRAKGYILCLFVSYASEISLRPGIPYTNVFVLHLETFK